MTTPAQPGPADPPPAPAHHCVHCGQTSHHPDDAREHYCGACHHYCDDIDYWDRLQQPSLF